MSNPIMIKKSRDGKLHAMERVYGLLTLHEPYTTSDTELADRLRLPKQDVRNLRYDLEAIEAVTIKKQAGGRSGFKSVWTLTTPLTVARARLEAKWKKDDVHTIELLRVPNPKKASRGAFHTVKPSATTGWTNGAGIEGATPDHPVLPDVLVASAGPEPVVKPLAAISPARRDEAGALVEAARQYATVNDQLDQKIKELEALGMVVDRPALAKAIKAPHDHQLLIVSKVIPFIDGLERQVERLTNQNNDLREKVANLPELTQRVSRLHAQNERLVAENTTMRAQLHDRGTPAPRLAPKPEVAATPGNGRAPER